MITTQDRYWEGKFSLSEKIQMPFEQRKALHQSLLTRCEKLISQSVTWVDVRDKLSHSNAGIEARETCFKLFAAKPKNGDAA